MKTIKKGQLVQFRAWWCMSRPRNDAAIVVEKPLRNWDFVRIQFLSDGETMVARKGELVI